MNQQQVANRSQDSKKEIILEIRKEFLREFVLRILDAKANSIDKLPDRLIEKVRAMQMEEKNPSILNSDKIKRFKPMLPVMIAPPRRQMSTPSAPINHNIPFSSQPKQQIEQSPLSQSQPHQIEQMQSLEKIQNLIKNKYVKNN